MKQFSLIIECVIQNSDEELFLIRDPRNGAILRTATTTSEVAQFLEETVLKFKNFGEDAKQ